MTMTPEEMLARLLYRDGLMLVVDKPAGLPVHRGPKGGDAFEDYFDALRFGLPRPPALAHRLDRDTTGCLVLGRHRKALALLGKLFKQGKVGATGRSSRVALKPTKAASIFPSPNATSRVAGG
jgi:tRNA pseudouridine32 synthase/23S rRNA pseudouridine746 synthase